MQVKVNRNGKVLKLNPKVADVLIKRGIAARYETHDMRADVTPAYATTAISEPVPAEPQAAAQDVVQSGDDLDLLDAEQLHALAKERGVSVHHRAGADKVRAALREAAQ